MSPPNPEGPPEFHWQPCSIPSMSRPGFHLTGWLPTCMGHHHTGNHGNTKEKRHCLGHVAALIGGCEDKNRNICCCRYIANWTDGNLMTYLYTFLFFHHYPDRWKSYDISSIYFFFFSFRSSSLDIWGPLIYYKHIYLRLAHAQVTTSHNFQ